MLTGRFTEVAHFKDNGIASRFPRFQAGAFEHNLSLVEKVQTIAAEKNCSPAQLAIGWVKGQSGREGMPTIIPIPGATTASRVKENAVVVELSEEEMKTIGDIVDSFEVAGGRYPDGAPTET